MEDARVQTIDDEPLRRDIRLLGAELDRVIESYGGEDLFQLVEEIRSLSKERRTSDDDPESESTAGEQLKARIAQLDPEEIGDVIRALSCYFDLSNMAEDRHRIRVIRYREQLNHPAPRTESLASAIEVLKSRGFSAEEVQQILDKLQIELVFTAHPTEAKRRTVRHILRRLRSALSELDRADLLPREQERVMQQIRNELASLWQIDTLRPRRPTVIEEIRRGIYSSQSPWEVVPWIYRDLRHALKRTYPGHDFRIPTFLIFGSWIGGDRDGNPYVDAGITMEALRRLRKAALDYHIQAAQDLVRSLSLSERRHQVSKALLQALDQATKRLSHADKLLEEVNPKEIYRRWLTIILYRLEQTAAFDPFADSEGDDAHDSPVTFPAYANAAELATDVELIHESLRSGGNASIAEAELQDWIDRIKVFGFHLTRLDIREDSGAFREAVEFFMKQSGIAEDFQNLDEDEKQDLLTRPIDKKALEQIDLSLAPHRIRDLIELFTLLGRVIRLGAREALGAVIVSMTHHPSDVLQVLWLGRLASALSTGEEQEIPLPVVPLFETIADLKRAPQLLDQLLRQPQYAEHVRSDGNRQICMIGYSDGTKDGGYLAANWQLYRCQGELAQTAAEHGVQLTVFHGRGGALGRGGGPAARGILSLPPHSVDGRLRITEQGEVIAERYDDPLVAYRHLEQVTWATLLVTATHRDEPAPQWEDLIDQAAEHSFQAYRELVTDPAFWNYFQKATPIDAIETLPIGSRPARRRRERTLATLRAIPFTFAWTQSRQLVPAFYGLGSGLEALGDQHWTSLREMYERWPFFKAVIDNAELALAKCDMAIAREYAELCEPAQDRDRILGAIREEYARSRLAILRIAGRDELLAGLPWLNQSIRARNPYVDPLNFIQVDLMRRMAEIRADEDASDEEIEALSELLRLSVQGIASGMRNTG